MATLFRWFPKLASLLTAWQNSLLTEAEARRAQVEKYAGNWRGAYADLQVRHAQTLAELQAARDERNELQRQLDALADVIEQQQLELSNAKRAINNLPSNGVWDARIGASDTPPIIGSTDR